MALFVAGSVVGQISGKIGGVVYSRNKSGTYIRNRAIPVNPGTPLSLEYRAVLSVASSLWQTLDKNSKRDWNDYAATKTETNKLGQSVTLSGQAWFLRCNTRLLQAGETYKALPPVKAGPGEVQVLSMTAETGPDLVSFAYQSSPIGANEVLWVRGGNLHDSSRQYVKNLLRQVYISGKAKSSPVDISTEFVAACGPLQVGDSIWIEVCTMDTTTGLKSAVTYYNTLVVPHVP